MSWMKMKHMEMPVGCCSLCGEPLEPAEIDICTYCSYEKDDNDPLEVDEEEKGGGDFWSSYAVS